MAKPGQRAYKVTEEEYYQMRREEITKRYERMKADDPSSGQVPAPSTRQLSLDRDGDTIRSGRGRLSSSSSNIVISSDLNVTSHNAYGEIHNRHRHGHNSKVIVHFYILLLIDFRGIVNKIMVIRNS